MPKKKIEVLEEVKKNYVRLALESGNYTTIARNTGISRPTLSKWIKVYNVKRWRIQTLCPCRLIQRKKN